MSKRQVVVEIDCEDKRCGECCADARNRWTGIECAWSERQHGAVYLRGPECLAAERKLRDLVIAAEGASLQFAGCFNASDAGVIRDLDAALAAIKGGA